MQDVDLAVATMKDLQGLGVRLSIDDFGTGYSSLSALKTFPVTRLKIDKSFIDGLLADENDQAVASAVISLGQTLNLRVIAEGVETDAQAAFLRNINCDEMQGYLFSKPLPAEGIEKLLGDAPSRSFSRLKLAERRRRRAPRRRSSPSSFNGRIASLPHFSPGGACLARDRFKRRPPRAAARGAFGGAPAAAV